MKPEVSSFLNRVLFIYERPVLYNTEGEGQIREIGILKGVLCFGTFVATSPTESMKLKLK